MPLVDKGADNVTMFDLRAELLAKLNHYFPSCMFMRITSALCNADLDSDSLSLNNLIVGIVRGKFDVRYTYDANPAQGFFSTHSKMVTETLFKGVVIDLYEPLSPASCGLDEDKQLAAYKLNAARRRRHYEDAGMIYICDYNIKSIYLKVMNLLETKEAIHD